MVAEELRSILETAAQLQASDIHFHVGSPPIVRIAGELRTLENFEKLTPDKISAMALEVIRPNQRQEFEEGEEIDTSFPVPGVGRFRVNVFRQRGTNGMVLRRVNTTILGYQELGLPPAVEYLTRFHTGLILVVGMTGSGKSTTLAAMIDIINENRRCHIVTLEDPIEYLYHDKNSIVTQREIGQDTKDFAKALRSAMRQDPDVILIGEMRDEETIRSAITAAETGHLVMSTLHTTTAPQTVKRILEYFSEEQQTVIRQQLAFHLRGVIAQRLVPRLDGTGMLPAVEVMLMNALVRKMIVEDKIGLLKSVIHAAANEGMQTFDQHLVSLYNAGLISFEAGQAACSNPDSFGMFCQGFFPDIIQGILE
ncbi:MAG: PilT/PilU family type 4a pilus ATPase [Candidatus Hydrogenedentota bacterium]|nr:MAG: PilT/PilU family type 4a pilus ATPase [Candidatus Hydrogenedentota bacterium]